MNPREFSNFINRYWIVAKQSNQEIVYLFQIKTWHNAQYPDGGWADIVARAQFFDQGNGYQLFNWKLYAGGTSHSMNEDARLRSVAEYGAKLLKEEAEMFFPLLPGDNIRLYEEIWKYYDR